MDRYSEENIEDNEPEMTLDSLTKTKLNSIWSTIKIFVDIYTSYARMSEPEKTGSIKKRLLYKATEETDYGFAEHETLNLDEIKEKDENKIPDKQEKLKSKKFKQENHLLIQKFCRTIENAKNKGFYVPIKDVLIEANPNSYINCWYELAVCFYDRLNKAIENEIFSYNLLYASESLEKILIEKPIKFHESLALAIPLVINLTSESNKSVIEAIIDMLKKIDTIKKVNKKESKILDTALTFIREIFESTDLCSKVLEVFAKLTFPEGEFLFETKDSDLHIEQALPKLNSAKVEELRSSILKNIPSEVYELHINYHNGLTTMDGIGIKSKWLNASFDTLNEDNRKVKLARLVIVLIHEMCHWQRLQTLAGKNYANSTPESLKNESGVYFETEIFGLKIGKLIEHVDYSIAAKILNVGTWSEENKLKGIFDGFKDLREEKDKSSSNCKLMTESDASDEENEEPYCWRDGRNKFNLLFFRSKINC